MHEADRDVGRRLLCCVEHRDELATADLQHTVGSDACSEQHIASRQSVRPLRRLSGVSESVLWRLGTSAKRVLSACAHLEGVTCANDRGRRRRASKLDSLPPPPATQDASIGGAGSPEALSQWQCTAQCICKDYYKDSDRRHVPHLPAAERQKVAMRQTPLHVGHAHTPAPAHRGP